ncbi:MAG: class I SAM-dependent methyltransferase [Halobacteriaceae archaeon]
MRRFSAAYLRDTRRGLWEDRDALSELRLDDVGRALDVGCGTGSLTDVLREETGGEVVGLDADRDLLGDADPPVVAGDATGLPFPDGVFDLVACQALLINLPDPTAAVREFARVATDRVAAVEPDNGAVAVESTVNAESALARRAREAYAAGVPTDVALGADARDCLADAGLEDVRVESHYHTRTIEPPYGEAALESARRKVEGSRLADARETLLAGGMGESEYEALRSDWQSMGRAVVEQMRAERYRRVEVVPFYVAVGEVP